MSSIEPKGGGSTIGIVVTLVVLLGLGIGAAIIFSRKGRGAEDQPPAETRKAISSSIQLVEAPPPLPETPPTVEEPPEEVIPVIEQATDPKGGKKKAIPQGTIDSKAAQQVTKSNFTKVRACYERQLKVNNLLQGNMTVKITVFPDGSVNSVKFTEDTLHNSVMNECIRTEILGWDFPKPEGGKVEIHQSYRFEPKVG